MKTPQWVKKLGGHAGELYVAAELSKRAIPNALLPENFSDHDIIIGGKGGKNVGYIQVKSCHPDRSKTFQLDKSFDRWVESAKENEYVVFVWLGSAKTSASPIYWIATKKDVGYLCKKHNEKFPESKDLRVAPEKASKLNVNWNYTRLDENWLGKWELFRSYSAF